MTHLKWTEYDDEHLLKMRICDLGLAVEETELEADVKELYRELDSKGLIFHPLCYLADEWFCPDEVPIIGIPFYLAHPRLKRLEMKLMMEVEGGTRDWCMKLLRHEAGHAYNYAYRLYKKKKWRETFGPFNKEYPDTYISRPYSRKYVRHLEDGYAQYHPDEDFAETFAVWLTPETDWRIEYKGWRGAYEKLEYVNKVMREIEGRPPLITSRKRYWSAQDLKQTLDYYYKKKRRMYAEDLPGFFDPDLARIFHKGTDDKVGERADKFILRNRKRIVESVTMWTGKNKYIIDKILKDIISVARHLRLERCKNEDETLLEFTTYVTTMVMNYLFTGRLKNVHKKTS